MYAVGCCGALGVQGRESQRDPTTAGGRLVHVVDILAARATAAAPVTVYDKPYKVLRSATQATTMEMITIGWNVVGSNTLRSIDGE